MDSGRVLESRSISAFDELEDPASIAVTKARSLLKDLQRIDPLVQISSVVVIGKSCELEHLINVAGEPANREHRCALNATCCCPIGTDGKQCPPGTSCGVIGFQPRDREDPADPSTSPTRSIQSHEGTRCCRAAFERRFETHQIDLEELMFSDL